MSFKTKQEILRNVLDKIVASQEELQGYGYLLVFSIVITFNDTILVMSLSLGIVGLPNVGKSTLFNALLKRQAALAANYPFATIEPNMGIVDIPDPRLSELAKLYGSKKLVSAVIKFYDIAGLVEGAHKGEGLGNKFLAHIREVDAIVHVLRDFKDTNIVREGSVDPKNDREIIETELILADLQTIDKRIESSRKDKTFLDLLNRVKGLLEQGELIDTKGLKEDELWYIKELNLLSTKPVLYVLNTDEETLLGTDDDTHIRVCAKVEEELVSFSDEEKAEYMAELGIKESGLDKLIKHGFDLLNLQTYLTAGEQEVRAWTITKGTKAPQAAGVIHTDFERGFIKAEIINWEELVSLGGIKQAKEKGRVRLEGKEYVMQEGDVVDFKFNV